MQKKKEAWQPPEGFVAVQTYISKESHAALIQIAEYNDRSLRAEHRHLLTKAIEDWIKTNPDVELN